MGLFRRRVQLNIGCAEGNGDYIEVGDRIVDRVIQVVAPGADGQPRLELTIDSSSGVPRCTRLVLEATESGPAVRPKDLRTINIDDLIEAVVPVFAYPFERGENGSISATIMTPDSDSDHYRAARAAVRQAQRASRRKVTPDVLRRVADVYRENEDRPAEAVEDAFGVSPRTAYRYISLAREQGFLEPREA